MSTYTDNYQLEKPVQSDSGDVSVLNRNSDKIDTIMHASQVSIADAYDENATYNTGDVVMYEFFLYICLEDNVTGTWDATKWERTTAATSGGSSGGGISYSTTEQDTGLKWIDGSSIYQITYTGLSFSSNSVSDLQDCTGLNIDTLVSIEGVSSNGNTIVDVSRGNIKAQGKVQYDMSTKHLYFYAGEDCPGGTIHVTLRYTKSSS